MKAAFWKRLIKGKRQGWHVALLMSKLFPRQRKGNGCCPLLFFPAPPTQLAPQNQSSCLKMKELSLPCQLAHHALQRSTVGQNNLVVTFPFALKNTSTGNAETKSTFLCSKKTLFLRLISHVGLSGQLSSRSIHWRGPAFSEALPP